MRPSYKRYVRAERERYQREGLNITYPRRRKPEIIYKDRVKEVEKIVVQEKIVYKERPVKIEEKPEAALPIQGNQRVGAPLVVPEREPRVVIT